MLCVFNISFQKTNAQPTDEGPVIMKPDNSVSIKILAKPGAKHNSITGKN